jgi:3-oxoacyl-[acyl-carrier protein] reductase
MNLLSGMNLRFDFKDRCALITGAAQGIGREIAKAFEKAGARVVIWDLPEVDVTDPAKCEAAAKKLGAPIDILVNNAGATRDKSLAKMSHQDFNDIININLTGVFNVTKALLDRFAGHEHKRIINLSSVAGIYGNFGQTNYSAAKAGVIGMTRTWARELGRKGFTVNAIAPGLIRTRLTAQMPPDVLSGMVSKIPVQRMGETTDIANVCLFLASEEASYVNGVVLNADGGFII